MRARSLGALWFHVFSFCVLFLVLWISPIARANEPFGISYQGRILKNDNQPLVSPSVKFLFRLMAPRGECVLYSEIVRTSMTSGDGSFSVVFGKTPSVDSGDVSFARLFTQSLDFPASQWCSSGYKKLPGDTLRLLVSFNDGSGYQSMAPLEINASPFALETMNVAGVSSENVLRIKDGPAREFTQAEYAELQALIAGTSSQYASSGGGNIVLSEETIPRLTIPDKVSGNTIVTGTIGGNTSINTSGNISTSGLLTANEASINAASVNRIVFNDSSAPTPLTVTLMAPLLATSSYVLRLPVSDGDSGQVLGTNGSGQLSWQTINTNYLDPSWTGSSLISTVGTITTGTWNASPILVPYGGTGLTSGTSGGLPYFSSGTTMASSGELTQFGLVYGGGQG